ncbi:hypothetical protein ACFYUR_22190 [Micromonospora haikouensis]|uniref:hypothetical protein n=1 Tax=Micromonospora haikouensis TaxID=686309 RepID=UPI00367FBA10
MTTDPKVTHPPVSHPEQTPAAPPEASTRPAAKPTTARPTTARRSWRMPPPKVVLAALLVAVATELLIWQVAGIWWGILIHAVLAALVLAVLAGATLWRRRAQRRAGTRAGDLGRAAGTAGPGARGRLRQMLGGGRSAASGGAGRRGLFGRGRSSAGAAGGTGGGRSRLGRMLGRSGSPGSSSGRGLLGRLGSGRKAAAGRPAGGTRSGGPLGRIGKPARSGGPAARGGGGPGGGLLGGLRGAAQRSQAKRQATETRPGAGRGKWGVRLGPRASAGTARPDWKKTLADFRKGFREGAARKQRPEGTPPEPKHASDKTNTDTPATRAEEKPQRPDPEQLVKEAVKAAAKTQPAVAPQRTGGTAMGDMSKIRAAAEEFAAALRDYDPESMHQLVRDMPQVEEMLIGISQGFQQVASRAESEWPVAGPVVDGYRSIATDIKAGASTAGETRGTLRRENETDIERGEAPRHGSTAIERKWNV